MLDLMVNGGTLDDHHQSGGEPQNPAIGPVSADVSNARETTVTTIKLDALRVRIRQEGQDDRVIEIRDPREEFCKQFNEIGAEFGQSAEPDNQPISRATC